ncbi:IclR family transcriptional regulator [Streptomyces sp. GC420]|uniref:IclR family transcriptional regulator n=1 Tax=Streptomyces sp. GC420 TaxID=2697568 RepID=UPI00141502D0|nr:helix-turn-helix domain-containing protein [Streptomyces sp. GC420]NBM15529.1 helix-turn-helix domain-containing protein [Streptomyces sp. GC420]
MDTAQAGPTLIGSVQRALRLLEAVARHESGAPAKQLAREAGLPLPTAYHLLRTLAHEGYLRREEGMFFFGEAAERLAGHTVRQSRRSAIAECLARWSELVGVPVYLGVYRDGEVDVAAVAHAAGRPAVEMSAEFRETAHAHAIGQCLLWQLDEGARRDHLARYPVRPRTPYTVADERTLLGRLTAMERRRPVVERQEYELGTACAAIPVSGGPTAASVAISLPVGQEERMLSAVETLRREVDALVTALDISISI